MKQYTFEQYIYLVKDRNGKKFVAYGDIDEPALMPAYLFNFIPEGESYSHKEATPFGAVYNLSNGIRFDPSKHIIVDKVKYRVTNGKSELSKSIQNL